MSAPRTGPRSWCFSARPGAAGARGSRLAAPLLVLGALLLAPPAAGLDPKRALTQYVHESWNTAKGLPQSTGLSLAFTRDGFLWVGTEEGIARFDGATFTVHDRRNTPGLPHNLS